MLVVFMPTQVEFISIAGYFSSLVDIWQVDEAKASNQLYFISANVQGEISSCSKTILCNFLNVASSYGLFSVFALFFFVCCVK
jgi:hypothetical protein